ncbi:hypothetical protein [Pseudobacteriovorax antillogorgiicola]|uniref:Lipoprotein n=1 Tax=Pseudobacteriovorax antillogorgiicola TaxID=1513793 RepID=A0A1Y6BZP3_9BACT|nr:hypothetical protein [Pseudobacteriovorax antillogorgiicola]TCS53038.1 hypothetical protein EDD56_10889 [Pseudobacteriovorax antillogorgiicola]SMF26543.1 hypothetical protein SAMN06296036_108158 [Pseudobacteriovorax antillogorgiicola]
MKILLFTLSILSLGSCTDQQLTGGAIEEKSRDTAQAEQASDSPPISEPVMVAGAFLYCAVDADMAAEEGLSPVGCAVQQAGIKVNLPLDQLQVNHEVRANEQVVAVDGFQTEPDTSIWHWSFRMEASLVAESVVALSLSSESLNWNYQYESRIASSLTTVPDLVISFNGPQLTESTTGLVDGHFDLDTSVEIYGFDEGSSSGHVHEFDKKNQLNGADMFNLTDKGLLSIQAAIEPDVPFKLLVVNESLSPGVGVTLNGSSIAVADFNRYVSPQKFTLTAPQSDEAILLTELKIAIEIDAIVKRRLVASTTDCVRKNRAGPNGEYRNGALTLQAISLEGRIDPQTGAAKEGLLWEATVFSHEAECLQ